MIKGVIFIKPKNILLIDSNPTNRYHLKYNLWQLDCVVHELEQEDEIITFVVIQKPKIVFVSLAFAKNDDFKLLHKIRKFNDCMLIVYTEEISKADLVRCINAPVTDVLLKPCIQLERLSAIVNLF